MTEFHRALMPDLKSSKTIASKYDLLFNKMLSLLKLNLDITNLLAELEVTTNVKPIVNIANIYQEFLQSKEGVSKNTYRQYKHELALIEYVLPKAFNSISYRHVDYLKEVLSNLPKGNIGKYKNMPLKKLITTKIEEEHKLSIKSKNDYLTTCKALFRFAKERNHTNIFIEFKMFKNTTSARNQRQALNIKERQLLLTHSDSYMCDMSKILYYSGMRLSEVYKCSIKLVDGVKCFDLSDTSVALKNESSHRIIPVHKSIVDDTETILINATSKQDKRHSRMGSSMFENKTKTLYSLRHTFATDMASKGVESSVISELLGHVHKDMTMGRYVKGVPVELLRDAVNNL